MVDWRQRIRDMLGTKAQGAPDEPDWGQPPFDPASIRTAGQPVVCVVAEPGLSAIDPAAFMVEPIGERLWKILGFELDGDILFADTASLERRGFQGPGLWDLAFANTRPLAPIIPTAPELIEGRDFCFECDILMPSILAELDSWQSVSAGVGPDLYAAPVADGFLLLGLAADGAALDEIKWGARSDYASTAARNDPRNRAISPEVFRFRDGGWRPA